MLEIRISFCVGQREGGYLGRVVVAPPVGVLMFGGVLWLRDRIVVVVVYWRELCHVEGRVGRCWVRRRS